MGPKYRMMPDRVNPINGVLVALVIVLLVLFVFTAWALTRTKEYVEQQEVFIDYWHHKTDSLLDANMALSEKYCDLKDSLITIKYGGLER